MPSTPSPATWPTPRLRVVAIRRTAAIELPTGLSLTSLAFKIADTKKSSIQRSTVAVDRMRIADGWPLAFRRPEIEPQCTAYQKAITATIEKCCKQTPLQAKDFDTLRSSVDVLKKKVEVAIPPRDNQRTLAREYVSRPLDEATRIFGEQAYAEELVRDVSEHKAALARGRAPGVHAAVQA